MSPPAVNWPPAPVSTTNRIVSSRSSWRRRRELITGEHRDPVELPGDVQGDRCDALCGSCSTRNPSNSVTPSLRFVSQDLRRIFPDALFGSAGTKRYSRGRLKRASGEARQCASSSSAVTSPTTTATTRVPSRSSGPRRPPPRARRDGARGRPRPRADGCSRRRRRSCRRAGRRPTGRRRRRDGQCRRCGTSRRGSPSRRRRAGSSSRRTPRRPRGGRRSLRLGSSLRRVLTAGRPAHPVFAPGRGPIEKV